MTDREQTALLAEKVMGWHRPEGQWSWYDAQGRRKADVEWSPKYSISDAWVLVDKLRGKYFFQISSDGFTGEEWRCLIALSDNPAISVTAEAPTAPEAICLAALKTLEVADHD